MDGGSAVPAGSPVLSASPSPTLSVSPAAGRLSMSEYTRAARGTLPNQAAAAAALASQWGGLPAAGKGKVTNRCLWHAFKAVSLGILLLAVGAIMSTFGYYAEVLSIREETHGNVTVRVKNDARGFHLNNLSYAGPIIMGVGGFIIVAACVMTFEARDSAAKVVPARFMSKNPNRVNIADAMATRAAAQLMSARVSKQNSADVKSTSSQTYWESLLAGSTGNPSASQELHRRAVAAAFLHFSHALQSSLDSGEYLATRALHQKCSSVPNIAQESLLLPEVSPTAPSQPSPSNGQIELQNQQLPLLHLNTHGLKGIPALSNAAAALHPQLVRLQRERYVLQRQALSVDATARHHSFTEHADSIRRAQWRSSTSASSTEKQPPSASETTGDLRSAHSGSEDSMAMDLHLPDCSSVTIKVRDESRSPSKRDSSPASASPQPTRTDSGKGRPPIGKLRSETSRRHLFTRQKPVDSIDPEDKSCDENG